MTDWYKGTAIVLVLIGFLLIFGGMTWASTGDVVDRFPMWVHGIGFAMIMGGAYLYFISRQ
jgi:hypothetical protein